MAIAPYQWLQQAERRGESIASERNAINDVYADYALSNQGRYKPYTSSVSNGGSPKFAKAYTYDDLVLMGKTDLSWKRSDSTGAFQAGILWGSSES